MRLGGVQASLELLYVVSSLLASLCRVGNVSMGIAHMIQQNFPIGQDQESSADSQGRP